MALVLVDKVGMGSPPYFDDCPAGTLYRDERNHRDYVKARGQWHEITYQAVIGGESMAKQVDRYGKVVAREDDPPLPTTEWHGTGITVIPHAQQRYPTVGDWWADRSNHWHIRVSAMGDWRYEFLVALHEQVEMALCVARGIQEEAVTEFDQTFEAQRRIALDPEAMGEPGDAPGAPYRREHRFAENIERLVAAELGVEWQAYDTTVGRL